jgi:hypothetical protein
MCAKAVLRSCPEKIQAPDRGFPQSGACVSSLSIAPVLLCKQAAKIFQTICKKETALKRVLRNLLSAISFAQI